MEDQPRDHQKNNQVEVQVTLPYFGEQEHAFLDHNHEQEPNQHHLPLVLCKDAQKHENLKLVDVDFEQIANVLDVVDRGVDGHELVYVIGAVFGGLEPGE